MTAIIKNISFTIVTPCSRVVLEKVIPTPLFKKFPTFYETQRFMTVFKRTHYLFQSRARLIQPTSYFLKIVLILFSHLFLCLSRRLFCSGFTTKTLYVFLFSPLHVTCPAYLILFILFQRHYIPSKHWDAITQ
jgi:hypothetical protein